MRPVFRAIFVAVFIATSLGLPPANLSAENPCFRLLRIISAENENVDAWAEAVSALNPIAWYRLGEQSGVTAYDETGSFNLTYTNGVTLGRPRLFSGGGSNTDVDINRGSNQYIIGDPLPMLTEFTVGAWIKTTWKGDYNWFFGNTDTSTGNWNGYSLRTDITTGYLAGVACDGTTPPACGSVVGTQDLADGNSHLVIYTYKLIGGNATASLWYDGAYDTTTSDIANGEINPSKPAQDVRIGEFNNGGYNADLEIGEVFVAPISATSAQLAALAAAAGDAE